MVNLNTRRNKKIITASLKRNNNRKQINKATAFI